MRIRRGIGVLLAISYIASSQALAEGRTGLASTANFNVLADSQEIAELVAERANELRTSISKEWLETTIPDGFGPATINVFFSDRNTARTWLADGESAREAHLVWLHTRPESLDTALSHEVAHVVLANRYENLPAFAHEAVASSYDGPERRRIRRDVLDWFAKTDRWPKLRHLLDKDEIASTDQSGYATAVSLRDFLLSFGEQPRRRFLQFAEAGRRDGWNSALRKFYGIDSVEELQRRWERSVRSTASP